MQSETEKLLSKQLRRDEKRIMREQNKAVEDTEGLLNIQKMRQERLVCLHFFLNLCYIYVNNTCVYYLVDLYKIIYHYILIIKKSYLNYKPIIKYSHFKK